MYSNYPEGDSTDASALLSHLNDAELQDLLIDDVKFENVLMKDLKQIKELQTEKDMILASNRSLAEFNISREKELTEGKRHLQQLSEEGQTLLQNIESSVAQLKEKSSSTNAETMLALLQTAAAEIEEESEKITEGFLEGDIDIDSFLDQFRNMRKIMHLRRIKADKMADLLTKQSSAMRNAASLVPSSAPYPVFPSGVAGYYPPAPPVGGTPYPTGPINMPIPGNYAMPRY